jgi:hypothetical protein
MDVFLIQHHGAVRISVSDGAMLCVTMISCYENVILSRGGGYCEVRIGIFHVPCLEDI